MISVVLHPRRVAAAVVAMVAMVAMVATAMAAVLVSAGTTASVGKPRDDRRMLQFAGRPNIVFVLTDDLSSNLLPFMPHVAALAGEGASFSRYFVVDSLCCPSRAAIFTGRYPHNDGVFTNAGSDGGVTAFNHFGNPARSYGPALQRSGYYTGLLGKYLNGYNVRSTVPAGWEDWWVSGYGYDQYGYKLNHNGVVERFGHAPDDYLGARLADAADDFVRTAAATGKPFALEVAPFTPHAPFVAAPSDVGTFPGLGVPRTAAYGRPPRHAPSWLRGLPAFSAALRHKLDAKFEKRVEAVQEVDRMVGRLQRTLQEQGVLDNTYFVFSSDNGFHMGDYGMRSGKETAFDTDIRVPLIVTGPGITPGRQIDAVTRSVDLAPTFAAIAGARLSDDPDGVSLLPLLTGRTTSAAWTQKAALIEHHSKPAPPGQDPDQQSRLSGAPPSYEALRTADALYVEYRNGEREYYDLTRDPDELDNRVAEAPRATIARLAAWLHRLEHCRGHVSCSAADADTG
jgi:N-acetylglucosamine-6-sulfatase